MMCDCPVSQKLLPVLVLSFLVYLSAGELKAADPYPPDIKRIKDRGALIVAQYGGQKPGFFEFAHGDGQNGVIFQGRQLVGFDIDLARGIAKELGVDLNLNRSARTFDSVIHLVASGQADIGISHLGVTLARAQSVNFTRPYTELRGAMLVNRVFEAGAKPWNSVAELCNRPSAKIGVWRHTAAVSFTKKLCPRARIVLFPGLTEMHAALLGGSVTAITASETELLRMAKSDPSISFVAKLHVIPDVTHEIAIAVRPDSPNLLTFLNLFLRINKIKFDMRQFIERNFKEGSEERRGEKEAG